MESMGRSSNVVLSKCSSKRAARPSSHASATPRSSLPLAPPLAPSPLPATTGHPGKASGSGKGSRTALCFSAFLRKAPKTSGMAFTAKGKAEGWIMLNPSKRSKTGAPRASKASPTRCSSCSSSCVCSACAVMRSGCNALARAGRTSSGLPLKTKRPEPMLHNAASRSRMLSNRNRARRAPAFRNP